MASAEPPVEVEGHRAPGQGVRGRPPDCESFLALECLTEAAILPTSGNSANSENHRYLGYCWTCQEQLDCVLRCDVYQMYCGFHRNATIVCDAWPVR